MPGQTNFPVGFVLIITESLTVKFAVLDSVLHGPATSHVYIPASNVVILLINRLFVVAPDIVAPLAFTPSLSGFPS